MLISVIVATYDWPEALSAVLHSLANQTDKHFEVIVADDGSDERTAEAIKRARVQAIHVWRPHDGFRAAEIRNRAILASSGEYCVFLDGDCIPRKGFVAAHRRLAEPGHFVVGSRVMLSTKLTTHVLTDNLHPEDWSLPKWWLWRQRRQVNRFKPLLTLPLGPIRRRTKQTWNGALSCNFAMWRRDLNRVDGFDASFIGYGWEDFDLAARLLRAGVRRKTGRYATCVAHLWHAPVYAKQNIRLFNDGVATDRVASRLGLSACS
jgi:glycosyltransferase involved in cell wall biosynthesis